MGPSGGVCRALAVRSPGAGFGFATVATDIQHPEMEASRAGRVHRIADGGRPTASTTTVHPARRRGPPCASSEDHRPPAVVSDLGSPTVAAVGAEILIVEDDELIASSLARALAASGHRVTVARSIADAGPRLDDADLLLCDLGLPDGDGLDLIAGFTEDHPAVPVIALTARTEEADVVAGLSSGAVDYVTKPFRLAELQARISAHLRQAAAASPATATTGTLEVGDLVVDLAGRQVTVQGTSVDLRPREFDLLARLAAEPGVVVRREDIMRDVWDEHWWGSTKTLDVHLNSLRRKLGEEPGSTSRITAVRGVGYRLEKA